MCIAVNMRLYNLRLQNSALRIWYSLGRTRIPRHSTEPEVILLLSLQPVAETCREPNEYCPALYSSILPDIMTSSIDCLLPEEGDRVRSRKLCFKTGLGIMPRESIIAFLSLVLTPPPPRICASQLAFSLQNSPLFMAVLNTRS
jgi:hypothetical protein